MSGHVQCEVSNEQCKTPVKIVEHRSKEIEYNVIKMEIQEEPEPSQMETCVEQLKCEEYKEDMQKPPSKDMLESQGLMNKEDIKCEMVEVEIDFVEHKLIYKDGQHEESEGTECVKLMESEGADSGKKWKQTQLENIEDGCTLAPGGKNILEKQRTHRTSIEESSSKSIRTHSLLQSIETTQINTQVTINTSMHTATNKGNVSVNSDNDCTDTDIDVDNSDSTHWKMSIYNDGDDKCLTVKHIDHDVVENKSSGERFRQRGKLSRTGVVNKQTETDRRETRHECEICQRQFNYASQLKTHLRTHTGERPFECEICKVRFKRKSDLKSHLRIHTGEKPFECEICQVRFKQKSHLKSHLRIHTGEKPFTHWKMSISNDGDDKCLTVKHIDHDVVENKSSGERFRQRENLSRTSVVNKQTETVRRETRHECEICQRKFNHAGHLKEHLRTHTGEKPFECEICQRQFIRVKDLKRHLRTHTGEKPFECEICLVRFTRKCGLKIHLSTHTSEKKFECELCKVRFKHKCNLRTHLSTHTGEKPFECEICQQKFNQAGHLKNHLRTHTGERPFECEICQVRFNQKGSLNRHLRTHEKPFVCEICKVKFAQKGSLDRHLRTHTGD